MSVCVVIVFWRLQFICFRIKDLEFDRKGGKHMSGLFQKKEKLYREPVRWKKELKLAPGYLILTLWILFTLALLAGPDGQLFHHQGDIQQ